MPWFNRTQPNPQPDASVRENFTIEIPGLTVKVNHVLRTVFMYSADPDTADGDFDALEYHLSQQGYFLQVIVASPGLTATLGNLQGE